ncbi:hypothetical protein RN001_008335 [Aquatica leii]|uniref:Uncharacterized protein n=1 Tax=Aquatica leii TaxID=1421715 RepID=A0AAN7PXA7_9COLE|nr:hypothetical protein RN001_008335 [Aquatica leii]
MIRNVQAKQWEPDYIVKEDFNRPKSYYVKLDKTQAIIIRNRKYLNTFNNYEYVDDDQYNEVFEKYLGEQKVRNEIPESKKRIDERGEKRSECELENKLELRKDFCNVPTNVCTRSGRVVKRPFRRMLVNTSLKNARIFEDELECDTSTNSKHFFDCYSDNAQFPSVSETIKIKQEPDIDMTQNVVCKLEPLDPDKINFNISQEEFHHIL